MAGSCGGICSRPLILPKRSVAVAAASSSDGTRRTAAFPPIPPLNPKDPFLSKLVSVAAASQEAVTLPPADADTPPYLDIFDTPTLMATPAQVERSVSYNEHRPRKPPPDLPSLLLNGRIVYIGMPEGIRSRASKLLPFLRSSFLIEHRGPNPVATSAFHEASKLSTTSELLYLQWMDPKEPIYLYINSTGTSRDDGETVGMESEGFAIYDAMMQLKNEIHTVAVGAVIGQACLLLAAGKKGRRFMMPHSKAMIQQPRAPSSGQLAASDVLIRAKEVINNRDTLVKLLAKHTGNSVEKVSHVMRRPFYMDSVKAKEFGVIDKILWRGQEKIMADVLSPEEWDRQAGIKVLDGI